MQITITSADLSLLNLHNFTVMNNNKLLSVKFFQGSII